MVLSLNIRLTMVLNSLLEFGRDSPPPDNIPGRTELAHYKKVHPLRLAYRTTRQAVARKPRVSPPRYNEQPVVGAGVWPSDGVPAGAPHRAAWSNESSTIIPFGDPETRDNEGVVEDVRDNEGMRMKLEDVGDEVSETTTTILAVGGSDNHRVEGETEVNGLGAGEHPGH